MSLLGVTVALVAWAAPAGAVVTQVDGTVLPVSNALQTALDRSVAQGGEGTPGLLSAVFDASVVPEVFQIPREANGDFRTVTFMDIQEGASYDNTIGWYNVSDPTRRYSVLTCTPTNHEPFNQVSVNFQAEFAANNYLGGYVGFFLVSPGSNGGCGNPDNLGQPGSTAFIVYTESQLNGDGNYVHYLIYQSKQNPLAYYFGFEDLWRGGDNDFDDMAVKVIGLIKPCEPKQEICDGIDNNCDGLIDNDPVDVGQGCTTIPGNHPGVGPCEAGTLVCQNATKSCQGEVGPTQELCNKVDDDCNGLVDDAPMDPEIGTDCGPTDQGSCAFGQNACIAGVLTCVGITGPALDVCDGLDNDCDGVVDGVAPDSPTACATDADCDPTAPFCLPSSVAGGNVCAGGPADAIGACVVPGSTCPGARRCAAAEIVCVEMTQGDTEVCDGVDNNCNGQVDEGDPGGGAECGPGDIPLEMAKTGQCLPGIVHCLGATLTCVGGRGPVAEICDGLDNDCNGIADETAECPGASQCVEGKCAEPCSSGEFPCPGGLVCIDGYCVKQGGGTGGAAGAAGGEGDGGLDGSAASGGTGGGSTGGAGQDAGMGGTGGTGGIGASGASASRNWGLTTGGGGASCALGRSRTTLPAALVALLLVGLGLRRGVRRDARRAR